MAKTITLTREELYKLVWEEPITTVAKQFGLSDVGLAKACKRHKIPKPERGYWAKKASGKPVRRIPLPKLLPQESYLDKITIQVQVMDSSQASEQVNAVLAFEKDDANRIVVPETLGSPHRLIQHTKRSLKGGTVDEKGILRTQENSVLDIQVTKSSFDRAIRIMNALVKAMESRGYELRLRQPGYYGNKNLLAACVEGEEMFLLLKRRYPAKITRRHLLSKRNLISEKFIVISYPDMNTLPREN